MFTPNKILYDTVFGHLDHDQQFKLIRFYAQKCRLKQKSYFQPFIMCLSDEWKQKIKNKYFLFFGTLNNVDQL